MNEDRLLEVDGINISYVDVGTSETVLLLIPSFAFKVGFTPLINELSKNVRVLAPDLPGFGLSKSEDFEFNAENYVDFLKKFLDKINVKKVSLFGNSMGGYLSLIFAYKYPDYVDRIIVRAPLFTNKQLPWRYRSYAMLLFFKLLSRNDRIAEKFRRIFLANYVKLSNARIEDKEVFEKIKQQQEDNLSIKATKEILFDLATADITKHLSKIPHKTLVLWGTNDALLKHDWAPKLKEMLPDAELEIMDDEHHNIVSIDPKSLSNKICSFMMS